MVSVSIPVSSVGTLVMRYLGAVGGLLGQQRWLRVGLLQVLQDADLPVDGQLRSGRWTLILSHTSDRKKNGKATNKVVVM